MPSLAILLLRFFVGPFGPRVRCGLPLNSSTFLFVNFLCALFAAHRLCPLTVPPSFLSLSLLPFCAQCRHGASRGCSASFSLRLFLPLKICVLAVSILDDRLESQAAPRGELLLAGSPTKLNLSLALACFHLGYLYQLAAVHPENLRLPT